jgi:hypothetical protein
MGLNSDDDAYGLCASYDPGRMARKTGLFF